VDLKRVGGRNEAIQKGAGGGVREVLGREGFFSAGCLKSGTGECLEPRVGKLLPEGDFGRVVSRGRTRRKEGEGFGEMRLEC